jgi:hypothetical protein
MKLTAILSLLIATTAIQAAPAPIFDKILKAVTGDVGKTLLKVGATAAGAGPVADKVIDMIPKAG